MFSHQVQYLGYSFIYFDKTFFVLDNSEQQQTCLAQGSTGTEGDLTQYLI